MQEKQWHAMGAEEVLAELGTSVHGLSEEEVARRLKEHGPNELAEGHKITKLEILLGQLKNPLFMVLVIAALLSVFAGKYVDTYVVVAVIAFNTILGFSQEYKAETALEALKRLTFQEADVLRSCSEQGTCTEIRLKATEIVPGDIVLLEAGDKVPADVRLFEAANLEVDESMLTGESTTVNKNTNKVKPEFLIGDRVNIAYSGTVVTHGRGKGVVVGTGMRTEIGKIATLLTKAEKVKTPIQKQTEDITKKLGMLALVSSAAIITIGLIRAFQMVDLFFFGLATAVSAIPEGLPAVMTITLAIGVNRMAKRNAIIRKLQAVDTLGAASVICTDKTGTLTTNQMTVRKVYVDAQLVDVTGAGFVPEGQFQADGVDLGDDKVPSLAKLLRVATLCNDARLRQHKEGDNLAWAIYGDVTEGALLVLAAKKKIHKEEEEEYYHRIDEVPFNSKEKYMITFHDIGEGMIDVLIKGAPEIILARCSSLAVAGKAVALGDSERARILKVNEEMASNALRVLGLAYAELKKDEIDAFKESIKLGKQLGTFLGLVGMIDPPRPESLPSITTCTRAGIKVIMATGDHRITAEAIGKELNIVQEGGRVISGEDLDKMDDSAIDEVIDNTAVFARVSPTNKYQIVQSLRRKGHIIAMTGDGVNDAPALKSADIGVAMGITGTDVAKEASDMILTDDNFSSIVAAIEEGRVVFSNVRKVVKYLLSTNLGEILTIIVSLTLMPLLTGVQYDFIIFTPVQVLWVNLVTDGVLDVTLATEPKELDVMDEPPRPPDARIINREILQNTLFVSTLMMIGTLFLFHITWTSTENLQEARTVGFTTLAMFQVFNALNCKSRSLSVFKIGLRNNKYLLYAIVISISLQIMVTYVPLFQVGLGTAPLTFMQWIGIFAVSSTVFVGDELRKLVQRIMRERAR
ncbi:MAG: HAD-IC family P-type ATPase [Candidatus Lokiarchaeota archaeon]|nr:HAD-IC family P-type ATPase [Candidatus Lokiarchaeota archaeon]